MAKDFAVVTFPNDGNSEDEIVSEVPSLWLRSNLTQCWWPSVKNINTFIIKQNPPVTHDPKWSLYPIQFHYGYYDSLDQARQKAMNYSSDDSNDSNKKQVKKNPHTSCRKQLQKTIVSESESDSDVTSVIPNPPELMNYNNVSQINKPSVNKSSNILNSSIEDVDLDIIEGTLISHKSIQDLDEFIKKMSDKMEDHFQRIYAVITTISLQTQDLNANLTALKKQVNQHKVQEPALDTLNMQRSFPLKSINEVMGFENSLSQNADEYNKFMLCISRIGGRSAKENLIRIYRTLFSNEVAKQSSWKGLRNHFKISDLNSIIMAIQATVLSQHQFTNKEFEDITKEWFRQGGQRLSRQQKERNEPINHLDI